MRTFPGEPDPARQFTDFRTRVPDLVGEEQGPQGQQAAVRAHRGQILLTAHDEARDGGLTGVFHCVAQQGIGLGGFLARTEEIRLVEVDGVDLIKGDEGVNVQRPGPARRGRVKLVLVHHVIRAADISGTAHRPQGRAGHTP
jgi:hypothetical protein